MVRKDLAVEVFLSLDLRRVSRYSQMKRGKEDSGKGKSMYEHSESRKVSIKGGSPEHVWGEKEHSTGGKWH